jgi:hypothetical protein
MLPSDAHVISKSVATDADGAATAYFSPDSVAGATVLNGYLAAVSCAVGDYDAAGTFVMSGEKSGITYLTNGTGVSLAANFTVAPRVVPVTPAGVASTGPTQPMPVVRERIKLVIAAGGATKTGTWVVAVVPFGSAG